MNQNSNFDLRTFIGKCKSLLPNYFSSLNKNEYSKDHLAVRKKVIFTFLKESLRHNNTKFNRTQLNANFINKFLNKLIPAHFIELTKISSFKIQTQIINSSI